jgi:hypothetical protein
VSDNVFDWIHRTLEIALTASGCEQDIVRAAPTIGANEMLKDLRNVQGELHVAISFIEDTSRKVRQIEEVIYHGE